MWRGKRPAKDTIPRTVSDFATVGAVYDRTFLVESRKNVRS